MLRLQSTFHTCRLKLRVEGFGRFCEVQVEERLAYFGENGWRGLSFNSNTQRQQHTLNSNANCNDGPLLTPFSLTAHSQLPPHHIIMSLFQFHHPRQSRSRDIVQITDKQTKSLLRERDAQIAALQNEVSQLKNKIANLSTVSSGSGVYDGLFKKNRRQLTPYGTTLRVSTSKNQRRVCVERNKMGRNASIATAAVLDSLSHGDINAASGDSTARLVERIENMFRSPSDSLGYLKSEEFAKDLLRLNKKVRGILEEESRCVFLQSPAYVFGDIHG
jgi:hypothetical protein